jgi:hypothetical protein
VHPITGDESLILLLSTHYVLLVNASSLQVIDRLDFTSQNIELFEMSCVDAVVQVAVVFGRASGIVRSIFASQLKINSLGASGYDFWMVIKVEDDTISCVRKMVLDKPVGRPIELRITLTFHSVILFIYSHIFYIYYASVFIYFAFHYLLTEDRSYACAILRNTAVLSSANNLLFAVIPG